LPQQQQASAMQLIAVSSQIQNCLNC